MNKFLLVVLMSFILSSTYEIQIQMDDYQGIRQGSTTVSYNGENAGKVKKISESPLKELVVTDTLPLPKEKRLSNLSTVTVSAILGEAIHRIHGGLSVGAMFERR